METELPQAPSDDGSEGVRLEQVSKSYKSVLAIEDISLSVAWGEIVCLLGPSGAGKSTLLNTITGIIRPDSGRIFIDGRDVTLEPPERRRVGAVFQSFALFPHMTVFDNVAFGLRCRKASRTEVRRLVPEYLAMVGLVGKERRKPDELSGGERQRVAFARALASSPAALALDEPFGSLDVQLRGTLRTEVRRIVRQSKVPAVVITHDRDDAYALADRVAIINAGRILQIGTLSEVYNFPVNAFVAKMLGDANIVGVEAGQRLTPAVPGGPCFMIRPEHLRLCDGATSSVTGLYLGSRSFGHVIRHYVDVGDLHVEAHQLDGMPTIAVERGEMVGLEWAAAHLVALQAADVPAEAVEPDDDTGRAGVAD